MKYIFIAVSVQMQVKQEIIQQKNTQARDEELSNFRDDKFLSNFEGVVLCLDGAALKR